jgi:hypothetical protein
MTTWDFVIDAATDPLTFIVAGAVAVVVLTYFTARAIRS